MATTWKITSKSGGYLLDLTDSSSYVLNESWRRSAAGNGRVIESFDVVMNGTESVIAANIEMLGSLQHSCRLFFSDPTSEESVWWLLHSGTEAAKWALVYDIQYSANIDRGINPTVPSGTIVYTVTVERSDVYEKFTHDTGPTISGLSGFGGIYVIPWNLYKVAGMGGYMSKVTISAPSSLTTALYRVWMGIRPFYSDADSEITAGFDATLEVEAGTAVLGSYVNDANASPAGTSSNCLEVTSVPASIGEAWNMILQQANATYYNLYQGEYLVLGRVKVNAGTTGVQLRWGRKAASSAFENLQNNEMVYVSNTDWRLIELGSVRWPSMGAQNWSMDLYNEIMRVYIQQIAGTTTSFKLDALVLIPSKYMVKLNKTNIIYTNTGKQYLFKREDGKDTAIAEISSHYSHIPDATFVNWFIPPADGFIVFAAERETVHNLGDTVNMTYDYSAFYVDKDL